MIKLSSNKIRTQRKRHLRNDVTHIETAKSGAKRWKKIVLLRVHGVKKCKMKKYLTTKHSRQSYEIKFKELSQTKETTIPRNE